jgi:hypothetical protein
MARSRQPATPVPAPGLPGLTQPRPEVTARLEERIDKGKELQARQIQSPSDMEVYKTTQENGRNTTLTCYANFSVMKL